MASRKGVRTPDLRFRKPLLYPAELPGLASAAPSRDLPYHERMTRSSDSPRPPRFSPTRHVLACVLLASVVLACAGGAVLLAGSPSIAAPIPAASACPAAGIEEATVASVDQRLEVHLKDGRVLCLAGFEPVRPTPDNPDFDTIARDVLAKVLAKPIPGGIGFIPLAREPDRWGRIPVFAFLPDAANGAARPSLAVLLLTLGYGRFMPEPEVRPCQAVFSPPRRAPARTAAAFGKTPIMPSSPQRIRAPSRKKRRAM